MSRPLRHIDITGMRSGYLEAVRYVGRDRSDHYAVWLCRCDCGVEIEVNGRLIRRRTKKSCGLNGHTWLKGKRRVEVRVEDHPEYRSWKHMRERCENKNNHKFRDYGGRGIKVCQRWKKFRSFLEDMGPRPSPNHSIERKNVNGDYTPKNCVWATRREQARNQRRSVFVIWEGKKILLVELMEKLGLDRQRVYGRLKMGWSIEDAITIPIKKYKTKEHS